MKHLLFLAVLLTAGTWLMAQDSTAATSSENVDTIRIGGITIIKKSDKRNPAPDNDSSVSVTQRLGNTFSFSRSKKKPKKVTRSFLAFDFGFNNFNDKTNYNSSAVQNFTQVAPGAAAFTGTDFTLRNGKSTNVNLWIFRNRYGIDKNRHLKVTTGLMMEMNNYRFDTDLRTSFKKGSSPYVFRDNVDFTKNKLSLDYITVPLMIGFDSKPNGKGLTMHAGVSAGYLYSSRIKQISHSRGKEKIRGNMNVAPWKLQYLGEVGLGPVKLYGSYSPKSMFKNALDFRPYNVGIRLGD